MHLQVIQELASQPFLISLNLLLICQQEKQAKSWEGEDILHATASCLKLPADMLQTLLGFQQLILRKASEYLKTIFLIALKIFLSIWVNAVSTAVLMLRIKDALSVRLLKKAK